MEKIVAVRPLRRIAGVQAMTCFGALLGALREAVARHLVLLPDAPLTAARCFPCVGKDAGVLRKSPALSSVGQHHMKTGAICAYLH